MIRFFDITLSLGFLIVFLPFGVVIAILLRLTGEGEVFYRQQRVGQYGIEFGLYKFATMLKNSPNLGSGDITVKDDPRVLPMGKFLRKSKLNEIPQLFNILKGDMSIVGPRPQTLKNLEYFPEEGKRIVTSMRPGLTGIGSIVFRDEETLLAHTNKPVDECYRQDIGPYKAKLEEWYKQRQDVWTYWSIIFITAWVILSPSSQIHYRVWSLPSPPKALNL